MFRVPIDLPLSCPHRISGGGKGCVFCSEDGARARHLRANLDIPAQVRAGIEYIHRRYGNKHDNQVKFSNLAEKASKNVPEPPTQPLDFGLIAYFQSFTNTNAPVRLLREYYEQVLTSADFPMVIIATRPDCLPSPVLDYLSELSQEYDLLIELGVQSSNDATLARINRGHNFEAVRSATAKLAERGIKCAAHVILGLPGETTREFRKTAVDISKLPFSAIKIHNMLVLRKTPLAATFAEQLNRGVALLPLIPPASPTSPELTANLPLIMNEYEYADALLDFVSLIPDEWPLMRLTADAPPKEVIAPKWWMSKGQFLEYFKKRMRDSRGFERNYAETGASMPEVITADGSKTLYHPQYRQHFHSLSGARTEASRKFIEPCDIRGKLASGRDLRVLDVGFGLGENAFALIESANLANSGKLEVISLEMDDRPLKASLAMNHISEKSATVPIPEGGLNRSAILQSLIENNRFTEGQTNLTLLFGDARETINTLDCEFDTIFLDPFSHEVNPELWTYDFIKTISAKLAENGVIVTYSAAFPVRGAMTRCGLLVGETPAVGRRKGGTIASFEQSAIIAPLNNKTIRIIKETTTGTPYRDPFSHWKTDKIRNYRATLIKRLATKGIPKWLK